MKVKHILVIFIFGLIILDLGALFKLIHWPGAGEMIFASFVIEIIAGILAIWKILTSDKFKEFLNS